MAANKTPFQAFTAEVEQPQPSAPRPGRVQSGTSTPVGVRKGAETHETPPFRTFLFLHDFRNFEKRSEFSKTWTKIRHTHTHIHRVTHTHTESHTHTHPLQAESIYI